MLDVNGRVLHHAVPRARRRHRRGLDTEPGDAPALLDYLDKMLFWSKVEPRDATAELAVLSVVGPDTPAVLDRAGVPAPDGADASARAARRRAGPADDWPGADAADLLVPRAALGSWLERLPPPAPVRPGRWRSRRCGSRRLRPRLHRDTDDRTIPHEVGWIGSAVHLTKGCYRGQETVARVREPGPAAAPAGAAAPRRRRRGLPRDRRPGAPGRPRPVGPGGHGRAAPRARSRSRWRWSSGRCRSTRSWSPGLDDALPRRPASTPTRCRRRTAHRRPGARRSCAAACGADRPRRRTVGRCRRRFGAS